MKAYSLHHTIDHPWWFVSSTYWHKYPNPLSTHVRSVDVVRRHYDPQRKRLRIERLVSMKQSAPSWLTRLVGGHSARSYVREVTEVDLEARTLTTRSFNLSLNHLARIDETVSYRALDDTKTQFQQEARIRIIGSNYYNPISSRLEQWSASRFASNAEKGLQGLLGVITEMKSSIFK